MTLLAQNTDTLYGTDSSDGAMNQIQTNTELKQAYGNQDQLTSQMAGLMGSGLFVIILIVVLADAILKGIALWKAARNNQSWWFVALLIFQSAGILPILYLLAFKNDKNKPEVVVAAPVVTTVTKSATK